MTLAASVALTAYFLWAFEATGLAGRAGSRVVWIQLTVVPVILGTLHVLWLLDAGRGGTPEDLALRTVSSRPSGFSGWSSSPWALRMSAATTERTLTGWGRTAPSRAQVVRPDGPGEVTGLLADRPVIAQGLGRATATRPSGPAASSSTRQA